MPDWISTDWFSAEFQPYVAVFCIVAAIAFLLARIVGKSFSKQDAEKPRLGPPSNAFGPLTAPFSQLIPHAETKRKKIGQELVDAGYYHSNALINFLSLRNVAVMGTILLFAAVYFLGEFESSQSKSKLALSGVGTVILVYGLPRIVLSGRAARRTRKIENALPDALDMLAMSVEGGLPLTRSLNRVSKELGATHPDLSQELRIIARQSETGSFEQAMVNFGKRLTLPDVMAWSAMMQQTHRFGGNVVGSLRTYADRIRHNRKQRAERAGNLASLKLLLPIVLCLTPPVFIVLIGPGLLDFRDFMMREQQVDRAAIREAAAPQADRIRQALDVLSVGTDSS